MMHFITPSNPNIFLIGVSGTRLYSFGERNKKLCILQKSIFDIGEWEELFTVDIDVVKAKCCKTGIHVASGMNDTTIWIAARTSKYTHLFSLDILTKQLTTCKMLDHLYPELALINLNLCSYCITPLIRYRGCFSSIRFLAITPRRYQNDTKIFRILVNINASNHCLLWKKIESYPLSDVLASKNIVVNELGETFSVAAKSTVDDENKRITKVSVNFENSQRITDLPADNGENDSIWHEITFCTDNFNRIFGLTRRTNGDGSVVLRLYFIKFSYEDATINMYILQSITVYSNFPSLESSQFFISYRTLQDTTISPSIPYTFIYRQESESFVLPTFFIIQTQNEIITVPLRVLSLSESAYLSLTQLPELPIVEEKFSFFQWIINLFFPKKSKKIQDPWMSLNFVRKTLSLSNDFNLV